ncbi:hypothetical protein BH708_18025 [Brachybacterium sp. P6-10-X1]|uniref:hypothetical protein n=1 Tax=Brachybacterium sp. P6-10-X1 TaxID=1903186 RepID=UPI0009719E04|nr:hypothetical protein [Brachybacterium sp. P6-10-X1]APX34289.1 hypothetical protein BH708_18025 [Brachybacterium sp. P6-10-X1]
MRLGGLVDPIAGRLLELQKVSGTQWVLRLLGVAAMLLALSVAMPGGLAQNFGAVFVLLAVAVSLGVQMFRPDSDVGLLAPAVIILVLAGQGDLTTLRAGMVGLALLVSHSAFALASTIPVHGVFDRSAWLLTGRGLLMVLAVSVVAGVLVVVLSGIQLGPWMLVVGALAVLALLCTVLPRAR